MPEAAEDRLSIPAASILVLLITLVVVTPLAIWRMAQQLASPTVQVISQSDTTGSHLLNFAAALQQCASVVRFQLTKY
jgi:hypothetical protein